MTHEEAIAAAKDAEWEVIASSRGMCGENHPFEAGLRAYLTARDCVLMPRVLPRELYAAAGNALVNGRVKLKAHHDYLIDTVLSAIVAEMDRREKRG